MAQPEWMREAWRDFGQREITGAHHNVRVVAMFRDSGFARVTNDETAWCAAFVGATLKRAGLKPSGSLMARSYLSWGTKLSEGRPGAIVVFGRTSDPELGHVAFWLGETADSIIVLGGNQSNAVTVATYPKYRLLGMRWPASVPLTYLEPPPPTAPQDPPNTAVFDIALAHVLKMEGGFTDDPYDAGGPTNKGITLKTYASWLNLTIDAGSLNSLKLRLQNIPDSTVRAIYAARYWRPSSAEQLPAALALMHFDASVNHGVGRAIRFLQNSVGVEADGEVGPLTRKAAHAVEISQALERYAEARLESYRQAKSYWRFGRGWRARVAATVEMAKTMAASAKSEPQITSTSTTQKGTTMTDQSTPHATIVANQMTSTPKWWGQSMTIWGAVIAAAATVVPALGPIIGISLTPDMIEQLGAAAPAALQAITTLVGSIMAIYGRLRASQPLERKLVRLMF